MPPTPGPVLVAEMLGVELSYVIILGIVIGIPAMILAGPVFAGFIGKKSIARYRLPIWKMKKKQSRKIPAKTRISG